MADSPKPLDLEFVRSQFPAFSSPAFAGRHFLENAGGSFACRQTIDTLQRYYTANKVQPYGVFPASIDAGALMDRSRARWAEALGVAADEVHFGPSTSMNTFVLAQALSQHLPDDAEVLVTNADHEANTGVFRRMAVGRNLTLREWTVDSDTGLFDDSVLDNLINEKTALVTLPHCSNITGQANPVAEWTKRIKQANPAAIVIVDGVSHAPHCIPQVSEIGCDIYLFSLYKVYSVHQGLMVVCAPLNRELPNQGHYFNDAKIAYRLTPAGPDHAQIAAAGAVLDYLEALDSQHDGAEPHTIQRVNALWDRQEATLVEPLLEFLDTRADVRVLGNRRLCPGRHPTIAFTCAKEPRALGEALAQRGVDIGAGHFYAVRLLKALDIDPDRGVNRISLVHYNTRGDVDTLCRALDDLL